MASLEKEEENKELEDSWLVHQLRYQPQTVSATLRGRAPACPDLRASHYGGFHLQDLLEPDRP